MFTSYACDMHFPQPCVNVAPIYGHQLYIACFYPVELRLEKHKNMQAMIIIKLKATKSGLYFAYTLSALALTHCYVLSCNV